MCGIVGIAGRQDPAWLTGMNALVTYRGPDDCGEYRNPERDVALAMRRLSILDLEGGRQPMSNEDGTVCIIHNGEIYNNPEMREQLLAHGHGFRTSHSDTETLLHLYERKQEAMLNDLNGMFAFVVYDRTNNVLFGARDRIGIKPLYYLQRPQFFAFASELKCFLALPCVDREIDRESLFHYMSLRYVPGQSSIFRSVKRVPPGHWFKYDLRTHELVMRQYWDIEFEEAGAGTEAEWSERIRAELRECVRRWTLSDVPIGVSLSGGIDSSTIVGLLGEMGYSGVKTYSLGFAGLGEEEWNELPLARQVASRWGTDHHELILEPEQLLDDLIRMVWHLDEPFGSDLPAWYVFQFMRQHVTVALTGTGGDELFGNYGKFQVFENNVLAWLNVMRRKVMGPNGWRFRSLWDAVRPRRGQFMRRYFDTWYYLADATKRDIVFQAHMHDLGATASLLEELYGRAMTQDLRNGIAYVDFKTQLVDEFLLMADRFSMAHSLEARVPFLDHTFVELVFRIPSGVRTKDGDLKYLLKKAVADLLPTNVLQSRKRGFVIPISLWLRSWLRPLAERLLDPERLASQGIFRPEFYHRFVRPHLDGRMDLSQQVWAALMFQLWHVIFIEQKAVCPPSFSWRDIC